MAAVQLLCTLNVQGKLLFGDLFDVLSDNTTNEPKCHFRIVKDLWPETEDISPKTGRYFLPGHYCINYTVRSDLIILHHKSVDPEKVEKYFFGVNFMDKTSRNFVKCSTNWCLFGYENLPPSPSSSGLEMIRGTENKLEYTFGEAWDIHHLYILNDPEVLPRIRPECLRLFDAITKEEIFQRTDNVTPNELEQRLSPLFERARRAIYLVNQEFGSLNEENIFGIIMRFTHSYALLLEDSQVGYFGIVLFRYDLAKVETGSLPETVNIDDLLYH